MALYEKGGWKNPDSVKWFREYVSVIANALKGKVKYWITFNEPQVFVDVGMLIGAHAPFEHLSKEELLPVTKNILLAHGYARGRNPMPENPYSYDRYSYAGSPRTAMDWNITPDVLYWGAKFFYERYKKPILITENGVALFNHKFLDKMSMTRHVLILYIDIYLVLKEPLTKEFQY